jgi:mRNA interferase MazF
MRGDIYEMRDDPQARGHEQQGRRYAVVLQSDRLVTSTVVAAPTSTGAMGMSHRPEIVFNGQPTRVLIEQMRAVDPQHRFGKRVGQVTAEEQRDIDQALKLALGLF